MHTAILEELKVASEEFSSALTRYINSCFSIRDCALKGGLLHNISPEEASQILQEVGQVSKYVAQTRGAMLAIGVAYNNTRHLSPAGTLPPEVLSHIFHLVPDPRPCTIDSLAQVCCHWRSVALGSRSLWTQVVYHPHESLERLPKLLDHVQLHLARSDQLPLHVDLCFDKVSDEWYSVPTVSLFPSIGARIQTLELTFMRHKRVKRVQADALRSLLLNSTKGLLTRLITRVYGSDSDYYIRSAQDDFEDSPFTLDMTTEQLDSVFSSIRELDTKGVHPRRTSMAYRGLVDLRLAASKPDVTIRQSRLLMILRASPQLRTFHFGMVIAGGGPAASGEGSILPVPLVDLEVLRVTGDTNPTTHNTIESLLPLLAPGPRPLQLFLECSKGPEKSNFPDEVAMKQTKAFCERSKVVELYAHRHMLPIELLSLPAHIRILVISGSGTWYHGIPMQGDVLEESESSSTKSQLGTVYFTDCALYLDPLLLRLQGSRIQRVVIHECRFYVGAEEVFEETIEEAFSAVCPVVEFVAKMPEFVTGWIPDDFQESSD